MPETWGRELFMLYDLSSKPQQLVLAVLVHLQPIMATCIHCTEHILRIRWVQFLILTLSSFIWNELLVIPKGGLHRCSLFCTILLNSCKKTSKCSVLTSIGLRLITWWFSDEEILTVLPLASGSGDMWDIPAFLRWRWFSPHEVCQYPGTWNSYLDLG